MQLVHRTRLADIEPARPTTSALRPGVGVGQARPEPCGNLQAAWKHPWLVGLAVALGVGGAYVYCRLAPPGYTSSAKLYVGDAPTVLSAADDGGGGEGAATGGYFSAHTQAALMASAPVLESALAALDHERPLPDWAMFREVTRPASLLKKELLIEVGKKDGLIALSLEAPDPDEAAALVNGVIAAYVESQKREAQDSAGEFRQILTDEKAVRETEMRQKLERVWSYKKSSPDLTLGSAHEGNVVVQRRAALAAALVAAQLKLIEVRAEASRHNNTTAAKVMLDIAAEEERQIRAAFEAEEAKALAMSAQEIEVTKLLSEIEYLKGLIASLDDRIGLLGVNEDGGGLNVRVVEPAVPVVSPSSPRKVLMYGLGAALGLVAGGGWATLRESGLTRRRIGAGWQLDTLLGLPVLAAVPVMSSRQRPAAGGKRANSSIMSELVEAFRTLRTVVYFSVPREQSKTILITSPAEREGKSTLAAGLAIAMAKSGRRILLVDADLRKPTLHRIFRPDTAGRDAGAGEGPGLSGVLAGAAAVGEAIRGTVVENLDLLPCGPIPPNPSELLNDNRFYDLLKVLRGRYDHVVLDSPPVIPVSDARILGALCDVSILVLHARRSSPADAQYACEALSGLGARVLGIVMNGVAAGNHDGKYGSPPSPRGDNVSLSPRAAVSGDWGMGRTEVSFPGDGGRGRTYVAARVSVPAPVVTRNGAIHMGSGEHGNGNGDANGSSKTYGNGNGNGTVAAAIAVDLSMPSRGSDGTTS